MKAEDINSLKDAQDFCEALLNDFENRISTKEETLDLLYDYTKALKKLFINNDRKNIREFPELLNQEL